MSGLNGDTKWLLGLVGPEAWVEWATHDPAFQRQGYGRAGKLTAAQPPDGVAVYWTAGLLKAGTTRANRNVEKVMVFVIDDVGMAPGKSKISEEMLAMLGAPEPTAVIETSPGNHQWQYVMTDGYDEDTHRALHASVPWKSDATAPSNLIRLPMGVSGKPGIAHTVRLVKRGPLWTAAGLIAACGGLRVSAATVRAAAGALKAPSLDHVRAVLAGLPNDGSPYCKKYEDWITFGHALYGATGGAGVDLWVAWCEQQAQPKRDPTETWGTLYGTGVGWTKLHWYWREYGHGGEAEWQALAAGAFDDGVAMAVDAGGDEVEALQRDVANMIAEGHADRVKYNVTTSLWHVFAGTWQESPHPLGYRLAKRWADSAAPTLGKAARAAVSKSAFYEGVEKILRADERIAVVKGDFDRDDWLLGTPKGTVDLRTGALGPAWAGDMISLSTNVVPSEGEDCPRWLKFIDWACTDPVTGILDLGLRRMLKQWAGYCLTGDVSKEAVMFFHGTGANGKGTFIETLQSVLGSYFYMATKDLFMEGKFTVHTEEIAALAGRRMVAADEVPTNARWNESLLKAVSGGGMMTSRHLYGRVFTFPIRFKVTIIGNEKPTFQGEINEALRRRLHLAGFLNVARPADDTLKAMLRLEGSGVLRWMLNGLADLLSAPGGKLFVADSVIAATEEYFNDNDTFGLWLAERTEPLKGNDVAAGKLFDDWSAWAGARGAHRGLDNHKRFKAEMLKRGYIWKEGRSGSIYKGLGIKIF